MVRLTKGIIGLSILTSAVAIAATIFTGLQWWETHKGGKVVEQQAGAASDLAAAAKDQVEVANEQTKIAQRNMGVSEITAQGTIRLASAAEIQASAAKTQADSTSRQVNASINQLRISQDPRVDVVVNNIEPYNSNTNFVTKFRVTSPGSYTIENAEVSLAVGFFATKDVYQIWGKLRKNETIDIVGVDHMFPTFLPSLSESSWSDFVAKRIWAVHAFRMKFKDASGRSRTINRCVAYTGAVEQFERFDCAVGIPESS